MKPGDNETDGSAGLDLRLEWLLVVVRRDWDSRRGLRVESVQGRVGLPLSESDRRIGLRSANFVLVMLVVGHERRGRDYAARQYRRHEIPSSHASPLEEIALTSGRECRR